MGRVGAGLRVLDQTDGLDQCQLERAAVPSRRAGRPPPFALVGVGEGADVGAQESVALSNHQRGIEAVLSWVQVMRITGEPAAAARAGDPVQGAGRSLEQLAQVHGARPWPPSVALGAVDLDPPVAVAAFEAGPGPLENHERDDPGRRRAAQRAQHAPEVRRGDGATEPVSQPLPPRRDGTVRDCVGPRTVSRATAAKPDDGDQEAERRPRGAARIGARSTRLARTEPPPRWGGGRRRAETAAVGDTAIRPRFGWNYKVS